MVTRSKYDHVALTVRFPDGRLAIFESLRENGVTIVEWDRFINKKWFDLYSRVVYRRLSCERTREFNQIVDDFIKQALGKPFKLNPMKLFRNKNDQDSAQIIKETKSYFCSELVATAYKRLGLLEPEKAASKYWPGEFS
jgi:uncharacterized protein YycO